MTECRCSRPTRDGVNVCDTCAGDLARALGDIAWLDEELDVTQSGQRALPTEGSSPSPEKPLPWNEAAGDARSNLRAILVSWVRMCHEEKVPHQSPNDGLPADSLPALSRWLMWRVDALTRRDIGADAVDEITSAVATCARVIDKMPTREFVGQCECGKDLFRRGHAATVACRGCDRTYDPEEMLAWMRGQVGGLLVTVREGAGLLAKFGMPVALRTVESWAERKKVEPDGDQVAGARVYRFGDLVDLAVKSLARGA